jgi:hypothetical protein
MKAGAAPAVQTLREVRVPSQKQGSQFDGRLLTLFYIRLPADSFGHSDIFGLQNFSTEQLLPFRLI